MRLRLGCRFEHDAAAPTAAIVLVEPHFDAAGGIVAERWVSEPPLEATGYVDLYGNQLPSPRPSGRRLHVLLRRARHHPT